MKRIIILLLSVIYLVMFSGCTQSTPNNISDDQTADNIKSEEADIEIKDGEIEIEEDSACEDGLIGFSSLEEFEDAIENAVEGGDVADLASLDMYYLPTGIPDGYELYKISAGVVDIGFWYLPTSYLESGESTLQAEAQRQHFLFISPRNTHKFENVQEQFGVSDDELVDDYFISGSAIKSVYWNKNGDALTLYLPKENEDESDTEKGSAEYTFDIDDVDISELLTTETVIVE